MQLVQVAVKCPRCGSKFNSRQVPEWVDTGIRNSELRQDFSGTAPQMEGYAICTCPACNKSDWIKKFPATDEVAVLSQSPITPHLQFRSAAINAEEQNKDFYDAGILYLYAAWAADDSKAHPQAKEYRRHAIEAFSKALTDVSCPVSEMPIVEYLVGELYRRIGEFDLAQAHLDNALPRLPAKLAYMSRKIIRLAAEKNSDLVSFETALG